MFIVRPLILLLLMILGAVPFVFAGGGGTEIIEIDGQNPKHKINNTLFCSNLLWYQESDKDWGGSQGLGKLFREGGISMLRYPGGEVVSRFHWKDPVGGGWQDSWDPKFQRKDADPAKWMGLDEYLDLVQRHDFIPLVGVNMESGLKYGRLKESLDEARDLVRHLLKRGISPYYYLDNESYHHNSHYRMTPKEYGIVAREFGKLIKTLDPKAKIILNWKSTWKAGWVTVLKYAGDIIDVVDLHAYWSNLKGKKASWERWVSQNPLSHNNRPYGVKIKNFRKGLDRLGYGHVEIGFYEWGQGRTEKKTFLSMAQSGLINGELMMDYIRAGVDHACIWPLRPFSAKGRKKAGSPRGLISSPDNKPTGSFQVLSALSDLSNYRFVASRTGNKEIKTIAAVKANKILVYLLNKSDVPESIQLSALNEILASEQMVRGTVDYLYLAPGHNSTTLLSGSTAIEGREKGAITIELQPWSLTKISFEKDAVND